MSPSHAQALRKETGEALTGVRAGREIEPRNGVVRGADAVMVGGRPHGRVRNRECPSDPARSKALSMHGNFTRENREIHGLPAADGAAGRAGKAWAVRRR
jgi:hypothetical protein